MIDDIIVRNAGDHKLFRCHLCVSRAVRGIYLCDLLVRLMGYISRTMTRYYYDGETLA